jgi:hypothetical protein
MVPNEGCFITLRGRACRTLATNYDCHFEVTRNLMARLLVSCRNVKFLTVFEMTALVVC